MTTKLVRQGRQNEGEIEQAPSPEPESELPASDPYVSYRQGAGELEAALSKLEQLEADIVKVQVQLEETSQKRSSLLPQEDVDMDVLSNLGSRISACQARLEHLSARLLDAQKDVQNKFLALGGRAQTLWLLTREKLMRQAVDEILSKIHVDVREMQRQLVWHNLAQFGVAVIDAEQRFAVRVHPIASNPLEDTSFKAWSQERESTMKLVRQEAKILLERLPKLLETTVGLETAAPLQANQQQEAA